MVLSFCCWIVGSWVRFRSAYDHDITPKIVGTDKFRLLIYQKQALYDLYNII